MENAKLANDLRTLVTDTEALLRESAGNAGEYSSELAQRIKDRLADIKERVSALEEHVVEKTKQAATATDDFVREHPWKSAGIAAGLGLVLGLLIGRR